MVGHRVRGMIAQCARSRRMRVAQAVRVGVCAGLVTAGGRSAWADTDSTWNGGVGNWGDPAGWDILLVPQAATNNAIIASGQATLDASYSIGALTLSGGVINGTNNLTLNGLLTWSGGAMIDGGVTHAINGIVLSGAGDKILSGRTLINDGTATWSAGDFVTSTGAVFANDGTFVASFDGNFRSQAGTTFFNNTGVFQKTAGAGGTSATTIEAVFNNTGAVQVQAGRLVLSGGGSVSGSFTLAAGTGLALQNDYNFAAGSNLSGAGNVSVELGNTTVGGAYTVGGVTTVNGGSIAFNSVASTTDLVLAGGVLTGTGTLTASGAVTWTGTVLQGSGALVANGTLNISGSDHGLSARTLTNAGSGTWSAGNILFSSDATFNNSGTLTTTFDGNFQVSNGTPQFLNTGLFIKSGGTGVTSFATSFNNSGTVRVDSGSLFVSDGTGAGNFNLLAGGIQFGGAYNLGNGASITGTNKALLTGSLNITGAATAKIIEQSPGSAMTGPGNLTLETFSWLGGRLTGTGTTTVTSSISLAGTGKELDGRRLRINAGATAAWSAGDINVFAGSVLDNAGTLDNSFDGNFFQSGVVNNSGLFVKSGGSGVTASLASFNNSGTARVMSGLLYLGAGASTGNFDLVGGQVQLVGGYTLGDGSTSTGTNPVNIFGLVNVTGSASARFAVQASSGETTGPGNLTLQHFNWTGGRLTGSGTTTITIDATIAGGGKEIQGRTLRIVPGASALWSAGDIGGFPGALIDNAGTFETNFDGSYLYASTQSAAMNNSGLFLKSGGTNRTVFTTFFNNSGTTRVAAGIVTLSGGGSSTGNFNLAGGSLELTGGYVLGPATSITGTNTAFIIGNITVAGAVSATSVAQSAGVVTGAGFLIVDHFNWQGGTQDGGGGMTLINQSLDLTTPALKTIDARTLRLAAAAVTTWSGGDVRVGGGGIIDNRGTFNATSDNSILTGDGAAATFKNTGLFFKNGGAGSTPILITFNNTGIVRVGSGVVSLAAGGSSSGQFDLLGGAMELGGGYILAAGATITGTNTARIIGDVNINGAVSARNVEQTAGTVSGAGTFTIENFSWKGGILSGTGTTTASSVLAINGTDLNLSARTISVGPTATATWSAGDIRIALGATINNAGIFNIAGDVTALRIDGVDAVFNNTGTLRKNAGTNVSSFAGVLLNNTGTLEVSSGTLNVGVAQFDSATASLTGGTWNVMSGGKLDLGGGPGIATNFANVTLDGASANFTKINDLADNRGTFTIKNGKQFVTGGTFDNSGTVSANALSGMLFGNIFTNAGTYIVSGTTSANFIFNSSTLTQTGPLTVNVQMINNGTGIADIGGPQNWGVGAHLVVNGGNAILRTDAGATAANLVIDAKGGTTQLKVTQHLNGLNVDGGLVKLDAGGNKIVRTSGYGPGGTLDSWNGKLDLADNRMIVDYVVGSPIDVIVNQLKTGLNAAGTHWTGNGLISSTAQVDASGALGYAEKTQVSLAAAGFAGESITGPAVLVRYTKFGDSNLDGKVGFGDFQRLELNFGKPGYWINGDFNYDGMVDRADLALLINNYGQSIGQPSSPVAAAELASIQAFAGNVPEPGGLGVVGLAGAMMRRRRRSRAWR